MPTLTQDPYRLNHIKTTLANTFTNLISTETTPEAAAEVLLHTILAHADQDAAPTTVHQNPIGYVILYKEPTSNGTTNYALSGKFSQTYDSLWDAQRMILRGAEDASNYVIAPVYATNLTNPTK